MPLPGDVWQVEIFGFLLRFFAGIVSKGFADFGEEFRPLDLQFSIMFLVCCADCSDSNRSLLSVYTRLILFSLESTL